ncbi:putative ecto-ADP-ribosyltransferase 5-like [Triplophysa rosa]|uniref:NAD(P)(+)--arginine ADP-ribosyltransferase n=1 Tax=Triplophysa rosa TaxID=992332 RepID=A0A9W7TWI7_TRIRA|nr:putative ecto-ADP-ribosyltransferase 5-like [Triplophysa rosa]
MLTTAVIILGLANLGQVHRVAGEDLDMAPNSVDDKYEGCRQDMLNHLETFKKKEISSNLNFAGTWEKYKDKTGNDQLTANHCSTRTGKANYIDETYGWYSLHFLLTDAIQILNKKQKEAQTNCMTTYRGINVPFSESALNHEVRFGQIASSSTDRAVAKIYGDDKFCFEIQTCEGADVSTYSKYGDNEREVLIPPYEKFKVTAVKKDDWCKTVFYLKSTGTQSNLNCKFVQEYEKIKHNTL